MNNLQEWKAKARPAQLLDVSSDWVLWMYCGGRGSGKNLTGAMSCRIAIEEHGCRRVAAFAPTAKDLREIVEGESGLLQVFPEVRYERSRMRLLLPSGAEIGLYTGKRPDLLRGPIFDFAWLNEPGHYDDFLDTWDNLTMGLRVRGGLCRIVATLTPELPRNFRDLIEAARKIQGLSHLEVASGMLAAQHCFARGDLANALKQMGHNGEAIEKELAELAGQQEAELGKIATEVAAFEAGLKVEVFSDNPSLDLLRKLSFLPLIRRNAGLYALRELRKMSQLTRVTQASTFENAENLHPAWVTHFNKKWETDPKLFRQEVLGEFPCDEK